MSATERAAWLDRVAEEDEPPELEDWPEPEELTAAEVAELAGLREEAEADARAAAARGLPGGQYVRPERRGPGQLGSARPLPGESRSRAGAFGAGMALDVTPGCPELAWLADAAAGDDDRYAGASDDELAGVIAAWDRIEAHACARKHAAVAEFIRRRPEPGCAPEGPAEMPAIWEEFAVDELRLVLAEHRGIAEGMLRLAHDLEVKLPGTRAAFRDGLLRESKVQAIAAAAVMLDPAEARAAEAKVLDRAGRLTPGALRAAIARAVMEVAPEKARKRREQAARDARVQRWAEDSGNAALMGRELPPDEVLAANQRITAWARELKAAGLDGDMDVLRARAYLDLLLGKDSRPRRDGPSGAEPAQPGAGPAGSGFAGKVTLTIPLATLTGLADRPGEIAGIGPVDPWLARDLARAAARNAKTTWCVTVTDQDGHAVGHGCARSQPRSHRNRDGPGFAFTAAEEHSPPSGYGTWHLSTGAGGPDLIVTLDPITTENCDHRLAARGHDPGVKLRHLAQVRHATCTGPACRRPASTCDFEHNVPYEAGGRTCLCNGGPKCRHDHQVKQHPKWTVDQLPEGTFLWTTPSGRHYTTEPTRYPV
jgi:hypothetical protein